MAGGDEENMKILEQIRAYAECAGDRVAYQYGEKRMTYRQLELYSNRMAAYLRRQYPQGKEPVVVYGHKDPMMLICFLACVKAGRAYCPVDISVPDSRVKMILDAVQGPVVMAAEELKVEGTVLVRSQMEEIIQDYPEVIEERFWVKEEDTFYIIFTSGSTGVPKGVQIPYECLNHYLEWSVNLGTKRTEKEGKVFLNQAPFSFDLSVMDLYTCLACGGTLKPLDKKTQNDFGRLFASFRDSGAAVWVSTPSFADVCLADPNFDQSLLPQMELFLFCGERLTNNTAEKLEKRFPKAKVINTYGPTESTVAMTEVEITSELCRHENPLPVGRVKPGTIVRIQKEDGSCAEDGEKGEIVILGDTVSSGYFRQEELTQRAFFHTVLDGKPVRGYHTGDEGYLKDKMLYYCGRIDLQVKLHGYRIELGDIENNILRLPEVEQAVVLPKMKEGEVKSLVAFVNYTGDPEKSERETAKRIQSRLKEYLPDYMVPKKMIFMDQIPMTVNGKADRKYLKGLLA